MLSTALCAISRPLSAAITVLLQRLEDRRIVEGHGADVARASPIADALALNAERTLQPARHFINNLVLRVRPGRGGFVGDSLADVLQALGAVEGDFVFVRLLPQQYDVVARRRRELARSDALGQLLWGCGIHPADVTARERPWLAVVRAIGGGEATRESLRQRLLARRNEDLVRSLDQVQRASVCCRG